MTIRLTMLEERQLALSVAAMTFSAILSGKKENPAVTAGFKFLGESLWAEVFGVPYHEMMLRNYPSQDELNSAMQAMVVQYYPEAGR